MCVENAVTRKETKSEGSKIAPGGLCLLDVYAVTSDVVGKGRVPKSVRAEGGFHISQKAKAEGRVRNITISEGRIQHMKELHMGYTVQGT